MCCGQLSRRCEWTGRDLTRDPERIALAYTEDSRWRNRDESFEGREAIKTSSNVKDLVNSTTGS